MLLRIVASWLRIQARAILGSVYNLAGTPGIVRDCDYSASICDARIRVKTGDLFTVITVNGLDIYFHRLSGKIDGVGFSPNADCTPDSTPQLSPAQVHQAAILGPDRK